MISDKDLVEQVMAGSVESYAELVNRWQRAAVLAALRVLGDEHLAQDIAQEAFVKGYASLGKLRDGRGFGPWLLKICRNLAVDYLRSQKNSPSFASLDTLPQPPQIPAASEPGKARHDELMDFVLQLPDQEKQVVTLRYFGGHSMKELAAITSRSIGTVTKQLSRAHARLRQQMERGQK